MILRQLLDNLLNVIFNVYLQTYVKLIRRVLIDGTVRQTPVAKIHVETPYFTGETTAICMKEPLFDLIIGNLRGVLFWMHRPRTVMNR